MTTAYGEQLQRFYRKFAPGKQIDTEALLAKYRGSEQRLLARIYLKYVLADGRGDGGNIHLDGAVTQLYTRYAPDKVKDIPQLLKKFGGHKEQLVTGIVNKYEFRDEGASSSAKEACKSALIEIYRTAAPGKMEAVDGLLLKYRGKEKMLVDAVRRKYNIPAEPVGQGGALKDQLKALYGRFNPSRLASVDTLTEKYRHSPKALIAAVYAKYNPGRNELAGLYRKYNPGKLRDVDNLLVRYKGCEEQLIQDVKLKYERVVNPVIDSGTLYASVPGANAASTQAAPHTETPVMPQQPVLVEPKPVVEAISSVSPPGPAQLQVEKSDQAPAIQGQPEAPAIPRVPPAAIEVKAQNKSVPAVAKKKNLTPLVIVAACLVLIGGGAGGYYYKFGLTFPFFRNATDTERETTDKSEKVMAGEPKPALAVPELAVDNRADSEKPGMEPEIPSAPQPKVDHGVASGKPGMEPEIPSTPQPKAEKIKEVKAPSAPKSEPVKELEAPVEKFRYHLAAGSFTVEKNAQDLLARLKAQGYEAVYLGKIGPYYKVSYRSFAKETDARAALQQLKDKGVNSWVMEYELK